VPHGLPSLASWLIGSNSGLTRSAVQMQSELQDLSVYLKGTSHSYHPYFGLTHKARDDFKETSCARSLAVVVKLSLKTWQSILAIDTADTFPSILRNIHLRISTGL
jgi:hypothetical protein